MQPLVFAPILKRIRWGGRRLGEVLGKPIGPESDYAESWEIADHADGLSVVTGGTLQGQTVATLRQQYADELFGQHAPLDQFPLLIKFLDANDWLSLQVHPNDVQARTYASHENGKTEAWIVLAAEPGSRICAGLKSGVDRGELARRLQDGSIEGCLNTFEVHAGDCVFVPAGTVHAIGPGIVLAEIQQQSNLTFRLHDWGRVGADGQPREIHVQESLECIDFDRGPVHPVVPQVLADGPHLHEELVRSNYFVIHRHRSTESFTVATNNSFRILMGLQGTATVTSSDQSLRLQAGTTILIPAAADSVTVIPEADATLLDVFLP